MVSVAVCTLCWVHFLSRQTRFTFSLSFSSLPRRFAKMASIFLEAAKRGDLATVQTMLTDGRANITERGAHGMTALLWSLDRRQYTLAKWLLLKGGASMNDVNRYGETVWHALGWRTYTPEAEDELSSMLCVMVLLGDAPSNYTARLPPQLIEIFVRGKLFRTQLPGYLKQQRNLIVAHCPLPTVLLPIEDMRTDWVQWL